MKLNLKTKGFTPKYSRPLLFLGLSLLCLMFFGEKSTILKVDNDLQHKQAVDDLFAQMRAADNAANAEAAEMQLFAEISKSGSPSIDLLMVEAMTDNQNGDLQTAYETLQTITQSAPMFAEGFNQKANVEYQLELKDDAFVDLQKTVALEPRHFAAWAGLGAIYEERGDYKNALNAYKNSAYYNPNYDEATRGIFRIETLTKGVIM